MERTLCDLQDALESWKRGYTIEPQDEEILREVTGIIHAVSVGDFTAFGGPIIDE